jgi:hypothetical protein
MPHGLSYAGVSLAGPALTARDLSGTLKIPERRGENVPVPGRHGAVRAERKRYGALTAPFEILVRGYDLTTGAAATTTEQAAAYVDANLDILARLLALDEAPLVHTMDDDTQRQVVAEARAAVEGERHPSGVYAVVKVAFESASAFWRGVDPVAAVAELSSGATAQLAELDGSTAPIDDPVITLGPGTNPVVTDVASGLWLAYDATIGSGQTLTVDCAEWELRGTGGLVPDRTKLRTTPGVGTWLELSPSIGGPTVQLEHPSGGAMSISVTARRSWLFG